MTEIDSFQQAQDQLNELLEAAKTGAIIPIRLPGQVEAISDLLKQARIEQEEVSAKAAVPTNMEDYLKEEAAFIGHAVHELRTPMTSIRGYTDMLPAMGELSDMQKQFVETIKTNVRRMEALLADVSYINKIRKGTLNITKKMELFKNVAMRLDKNLRPLAEELDRQLIFETPDGLPLLNTDGDMLAVGLGKMIENSLKYSPKGEGKVTVTSSADGNKLVIQIADNGCGITPEEMEQLGTIYFRSDNDIVREYKGSGLGIPIAFGMMDLLGGKVEIDSTPDVGTTVTVRIDGMT